MSQQGYLAWYTNSSEIDLVGLLKKLPRIVGIDKITFISRGPVVSSAYDLDWEFDDIDESSDVRELHRLFMPDKVLDVHADSAKLGERIERGVLVHIPTEIRGDFMPNRPCLTVGPHFLVDSADEDIQTPCRAEVGCWGYSTPDDGEEFKNRVVRIPEVLATKQELEVVMGPLQIGCYFHF